MFGLRHPRGITSPIADCPAPVEAFLSRHFFISAVQLVMTVIVGGAVSLTGTSL